jgi:hypothetical protein
MDDKPMTRADLLRLIVLTILMWAVLFGAAYIVKIIGWRYI